MNRIHLEVVAIRGCSFPCKGPRLWAAKSLTFPLLVPGRMAIVNKTMPKPPTHCVRLRQNSKA